ncbi:helix-turn-helix transcriptional regulator [Microbacterium sp. A82]|uniref:helix-turn-helix transcriptional regulator n=1 Tax=Microbacterium sp. A82 TaxID=3450452 RepID=UPI003F3258C4
MSEKAQPLLAADRVRAYLTLVPYLLERGQVSLEDAANEFGVSTAEMRTMVEKLTVIGLPGEDGFWQQPQEMFDINWDLLDQEDIIEITNEVGLRRVPRFTAREAAALLTGLQMVAAVPAVAGSGLVAGLLAKLSRAAADAPAEVVIAPTRVDNVRNLVSAAVDQQVALSFRYQAPDAAATTRTVDPVQVLITDGQWYLQGWCHLREAMRTFHLDRVSDPELTDIPITHGDEHLPDSFIGISDDDEVTVQLPERLVPLLGAYVHADNSESYNGRATIRIRMSDPRGVKRIAGRFGGALEVQDPVIARTAAREWAAAGLTLYGQP